MPCQLDLRLQTCSAHTRIQMLDKQLMTAGATANFKVVIELSKYREWKRRQDSRFLPQLRSRPVVFDKQGDKVHFLHVVCSNTHFGWSERRDLFSNM